ncbi:T9SS type A sorting domain-containing protein, partial [Flavobacterium sp.]|uniref:T9SS type A sorting domain-containing protein n=1 Tax=Flavobacterium sp. TaxID=239 RepID=UPI003C6EF0A2
VVSGLDTVQKFEIYNLLGLKVLEGEVHTEQKIPVSTLIKGLYFIRVGTTTLKFVKN